MTKQNIMKTALLLATYQQTITTMLEAQRDLDVLAHRRDHCVRQLLELMTIEELGDILQLEPTEVPNPAGQSNG